MSAFVSPPVPVPARANFVGGEIGMRTFESENLFFVERSIMRDSEFWRVGGPVDHLPEAQERFAAVLTLAPKSSVRLRRGNEIFAEAHYGNVVRHDPPRAMNAGW